MLLGLAAVLLQFLQILLLPVARFPHVLQGLLQTCDSGTQFIVTALYRIQAITGLIVMLPDFFQPAFYGALFRHRSLMQILMLTDDAILCADLGVEFAPVQRLQFGLHAPLFLIQVLIPFRGTRLTMQMLELLGHLLKQIIQALDVFAGVMDAAFRFAAPFLVPGDTGGFLKKDA